MSRLYDPDTLRPYSLFKPGIPELQVTVQADKARLGRVGQGRGRAAEVVMAVRRSPDEILLVNKSVYPGDTYRLPTGGIEAGETPQAAAIREIFEETGCRVTAPGLLGVVDYDLHLPGAGPAPFASYIFMADVDAATTPQSTVPGEVDDFRWVRLNDIPRIAHRLRTLPASWDCWGRFRAASYEFIQCTIMQYNQTLNSLSVTG